MYKVSELPRIDCVLISNTHFNHLDLKSVRQLNDRFGEMLLWYCPMGVADWLTKAGCVQVVEMDWWKEDEVDFIDHSKVRRQFWSCMVGLTTLVKLGKGTWWSGLLEILENQEFAFRSHLLHVLLFLDR